MKERTFNSLGILSSLILVKSRKMEILNLNERQGKSIEDLEGSYKIIGLSMLIFIVMMAYTSLNKSAKNSETQLEKKAEMQLVQNR